jgi:phage terminase small subunit
LLTPKQRMFVEAYDGDPIYAARIAGYTGAKEYLTKTTNTLLEKPIIIEAIKERTKYMTDLKKTIATREERQQLWSDVMRNEDPHRIEELDSNGVPLPIANIPLLTRMKASELLGKSEADFIDKVETTVTHSLSDLVMQSYKLNQPEDLSIEAIEAEYFKAKENNTLPKVNPIPDEPIQDLEDLI